MQGAQVMKVALLLFLCFYGILSVKANSPPKFALDGASEIVVKVREGPDSVGKLLYRLRGEDADGDRLTFGVVGPVGKEILRFERLGASEANVYLNKELDREVADSYSLVLTLTDGRLGEGQFIRHSMLIIVEDVNDNEPIFKSFRSTINVREDSPPKILETVEAIDSDAGPFGQVIYQLGNVDKETSETFSVQTSQGKGVINLVGPLDYERKGLYQLRVLAIDRANTGRRNTATAAILVKVEDVEDQPPVFISVPSVTRIPEDLPPNSAVLSVKAVDGDRGVNNAITYRISKGSRGLFSIDRTSGLVIVSGKLDRENTDNRNGAFILEIEAQEVALGVYPSPSVTTEVTIIVTDVNDETPTFLSRQYTAEINENAEANVPVNFLGSSIADVFDHDQGNNGTFRIFLEGDDSVFDVTPSEGVNEASFLIRVKNSQALDYERIQEFNFRIVAQETVPILPKSSTADVTVYIRDTNDNFPEFSEDVYRVSVPENAEAGTILTTIQAQDRDSGDFGTRGIRYTDLRGQIADKLRLDPLTGVISIENSDHGMDRETTAQYFVTVEARDNNGLGNRNTVQLVISVDDVNDNTPRFLQQKYEARLNENEDNFLTPLIVQAQDDDLRGSSNSQVRYQIVDGDRNKNFTINQLTGEIRPRTMVDFEKMSNEKGDIRTFELKVRAYDLGSPSLYSDVPVIIYVQDVNDFPPVFVQPFYSKSIPEDTPPGTSVVQVKALDGDHSSSNSQVVYRIQSGAQDKFVIDADSGIISVARGANLDPDRTIPKSNFYLLDVVALDGGIGTEQQQNRVPVNISIMDVNNKAPKFVDPKPAIISENAEVGTVVTKVSAIDADERPVLRFSLDYRSSEGRTEEGALVSPTEYDYNNIFAINAVDGTLTVAKSLDREKMEVIKLVIKVEDLAAATKGQTSTATLSVRIDDVNDNKPHFQKRYYRQAVTENTKPGSPIVTVVAEDADKNRSLIYSLQGSPDIIGLVGMDKKSGEVSVSNKIDREMFSWLNVTVIATDSGIPPLSGAADIFIQVLDENDNNPVFVNSASDFSVAEDVTVGTEVALVQATDADVGEYGKITYLLDTSSTQGHFKINKETGSITVASPLDREDKDVYTLVVQAWDNYDYGFSTGESRKAFKQITVHVTDVNDEAPIFIKQEVCATVTEFHRIRDTIFMVSASDADDSTTPNGKLQFSIVGGNDEGLFGIENQDSNTARVVSRYSLRGRFGNYSLVLQAQDSGNPPLHTTSRFQVCVTDVNDNSPVFVKPPQNYTIRVLENATLGSSVVEVSARDADIGLNGEVRYRFKKLANGHWKAFNIHEISGVITVREALDRERQKVYEVRVEAYDLGQPTSLSTDLDLTIFVVNVDDNAPEFTEDDYEVMFTENLEPGKESFKLIATVDKDDDSGSRKPIPCYFIVGGNHFGRFKLDIFTHQLYCTEVLDREERQNYTLIVQASDDCFHQPTSVTRFDPRDNSLLQVHIGVKDINDNPPRFIKRVFTGGITAETDFGTAFMIVKAIDLDIGKNAAVTYYIAGDVQMTLSEGLESLKVSPFIVNKDTGVISLNFDPQKGMKGYFDFEVIANDTDGLFDTARVFIYLLREDQRVRFVLRLTPEEIREKLEKFREVLSNITGAIVNVDETKYHENRDGSVDKKKSDLYLHFVNREDNSIMEVATVLSLIDKNIEFLDELFKEFNVLYSEPADTAVADTNVEAQVRAWLIGLSVFLAIMLVLVISLCITQRSRYERKLKAATATAFGSQESALNRMDVPNTNQHSVEGSNPIWMHSYDNEWYKEDEQISHNSGDNNSLDENAISEVSAPNEHSKTGTGICNQQTLRNNSDNNYSQPVKNGIRGPAPRHPNYGGKNIPPAKLIAPLNHNNKPIKNGSHIIDSDDTSSGLLSHDSIDTKRQNDLNKCNAVYSYEQIPKLITPPHITNLETSEL
ncbi:cadherin-23-like isoform X2 [Stegodyphus dumicola]|uniref:cadherin-23-like isoform X2 n=1 Tax=Stegodyphus dumicola TaxID=202533 RepID=UPI0015AFE4AE|nr:cadherin-23-like isoform X2 [Stegodyphus dumicola]